MDKKRSAAIKLAIESGFVDFCDVFDYDK